MEMGYGFLMISLVGVNGGGAAIHTHKNLLFKGESPKACDFEKAMGNGQRFEGENHSAGSL
jgi:hypothetical protein